MKISEYIKRTFIYCIGLFIMALGVSISKMSNLGVSPVNAVPCVLSNIISIDMGICTTSVFVCFIAIQFAIMRREFKLINLLQILCSFLFGFFVSFSNYLCEIFLPPVQNYFVSIIYLVISIVFVALGILLYLNANILSLPGEGVMQAMSHKTGMKVSTAKIIFDWSLVLTATVLSLIFCGKLDGVREGTVIAAFGVGIVLKWLENVMTEPLNKLLYNTQNSAA